MLVYHQDFEICWWDILERTSENTWSCSFLSCLQLEID